MKKNIQKELIDFIHGLAAVADTAVDANHSILTFNTNESQVNQIKKSGLLSFLYERNNIKGAIFDEVNLDISGVESFQLHDTRSILSESAFFELDVVVKVNSGGNPINNERISFTIGQYNFLLDCDTLTDPFLTIKGTLFVGTTTVVFRGVAQIFEGASLRSTEYLASNAGDYNVPDNGIIITLDSNFSHLVDITSTLKTYNNYTAL